MTAWDLVQDFADKIADSPSLTALESTVDAAINELGFRHYALISHVNFEQESGVAISNYPPSWLEEVIAQRYYLDDPVMMLSEQRIAPFLWSDMPNLMALSDRQKTILADARRRGLAEGFTTPVKAHGEVAASVNLAAKGAGITHRSVMPAAHYLSTCGFEAARRLSKGAARPRQVVALTSRQVDVIALLAQGKTEWEIATILGIGQSTVHSHISEAKTRYSVTTRTQLAIFAIFDGHISFRDVLPATAFS